jgi:hypothetical protein
MVVFGARMDEANRRALEDALVAELAKHDVKAVPSYELFPGEPPELDQARSKVRELGVEGILVANLKKLSEKTYFVPAYAGGFWNNYYGPGWAWGSPGYVVTDEVVTFEPMLWDARAPEKLVWAALTKTTNPSAGREYIESLTEAVVPELDKASLIPPRRN